MKFIIEGTEGAGKSRLAKRLAMQTGATVIHRSKPKDEYERQQMTESYIRQVQEPGDAIFDRCWYSELVYGPIMRDQSYMTIGQMLDLEKLIVLNGGGIIIHCTDEEHLLWHRCQTRGEDYIKDRNTLHRLKWAYEDLFHKQQHVLPVVRYELSKQILP